MTEKTNKDIDPSILKKLKIKLSDLADLSNEKFEDFIQDKLLYPSKQLEKVPVIKKTNKKIKNVIDKSLRKNKKGGLIKKNVGGLVGRQKKIDADGSGNITAKDFKLLRDGNKFVAKQHAGTGIKEYI